MQNDDHHEHTTETAEPAHAPAVETTTVEAPVTVAKAPETDLLTRVQNAYQTLQQQVADNQAKTQQQRHLVAELRAQLRQRSTDLNRNASPELENHHDDLHENKVLMQNDDCGSLIRHAEQIRENIYHNSSHAETLLPIVTQHLALLELRLRYIRALETLVEDIKQGEALNTRLHAAEAQLQALADALGISA